MMETLANGNWLQLNQTYLKVHLQRLRLLMHDHLQKNGQSKGQQKELDSLHTQLLELHTEMEPPPAIESLCKAFALTNFERDALLLGTGVEIEAGFADDVAAINGNTDGANFAVALSVLPDSHWSALTTGGPLRYWRLISLQTRGGFITSPYKVDERVIHYLAGIDELDARMLPYLQLITPPTSEISRTHASAIEQLSLSIAHSQFGQFSHVVQVFGDNDVLNRITVSLACKQLRMRCFRMLPGVPAGDPVEIEAFARLWERESVLSHACLLVELSDEYTPTQLENLLTHIHGPVIYAGGRHLNAANRKVTVLEPPELSKNEFISYWQQHTEPFADALNGYLERVVDQFQLNFNEIQTIGSCLVDTGNQYKPEQLQQQLWSACRLQARQNMDTLAQRIEPVATWEDLVLPELAIETLKHIAVQVRHKQTVYEQWGFRQTSNRGFGISALFAGESGTGKTMAAEVIANELHLDLYRIDLSQVVNKYIGETEKNLKKVFDAAERSGAILLFDEADALFGKRSDVKDSHDRYANIEISFLLQRMESYNGLAILTTNLRKSIDTAFLRRLRFVVQFPFPDSQDRSRIWKRVFPHQTPLKTLEYQKLARLNIAGGNIRNIAMNAAFIAARDNTSVDMEHIIQAARAEYIKMDKLLNDSEWRGFA